MEKLTDKQISELSKEEADDLIKSLQRELERKKKYGLIWDRERDQEDCVKKCLKEMPLLSLSQERTVLNGGSSVILAEGENFNVLSALNLAMKSDAGDGMIDIVYIDPPYNTGNEDFTYNDKAVLLEDGFRHPKWLNGMETRLTLARELMSDKALIFISIDDHEQAQLKLLCDSIFGEQNFVCMFVRKNKAGSGHDSTAVAVEFDYVICYAKDIQKARFNQLKVNTDDDPKYKLEDEYVKKRGKYYLRDLDYRGSYSEGLDYPITTPDGTIIWSGGAFGRPNTWRWSKSKFEWGKENGFIVFSKKKTGWKVYIKQYQFVDNNDEPYERSIPYRALIEFQNGEGSSEVSNILGKKYFSYPKPVSLIKYLIGLSAVKDPIILDFFAGSGTTAQAVVEMNNEDGGHRLCIVATNNEVSKGSEERFVQNHSLSSDDFAKIKIEDKDPEWQKWKDENGICSSITYQRIKTVITGIRQDGTKYSDGKKASLFYFKTNFLEVGSAEKCLDDIKLDLAKKCSALLCLKEDCFLPKEEGKNFSSFSDIEDKKRVFIFFGIDAPEQIETQKQAMASYQGKKIVYEFSFDDEADDDLVDGLENCEIKPIPTKILRRYKNAIKRLEALK
jgi:adenine-specific DNA-methyltransferase